MESLDIQKIIKAAHLGGAVLKKYFGQTLELKEKSTVFDFQTIADLESEKAILSSLKADFPGFNIHAEEEGKTDNGSEYWFVVDPLDGTNNFILGIPNFSVSIALIHKNKTIAGVVYVPILDRTYYAVKGAGAFLNGEKIKVNEEKNFKKITIAYNCNYKTDRDHIAKIISSLISLDTKRVSTSWSPAYDYCLLASGKIETIVNDGSEIYDFAAGKIIAEEAGAKVLELDSPNKFLVANSEEINKKILRAISE